MPTPWMTSPRRSGWRRWMGINSSRPATNRTSIMTITLDLTGHIALVTGASRGIGAAIALALAEAGAAVAVNYRERADDAEAIVAAIKANGGRAIAVAADVSQAAN